MSNQNEGQQQESGLVLQVRKDMQNVLPEHDKNSQEAMKVASQIVIQTDADDAKAADLIARIKQEGRAVEDLRKSLGDPFRKVVDFVNSNIKQISERFSSAETLIKTKVGDYRDRKEKLIQEENARIAKANEEAERKRIKAEMDAKAKGKTYVPPKASAVQTPMPIAPVTTVGEGGGKLSDRKKWIFEVTDIHQVPRNCMMVNEKVVQALIDSGTREIAGIRIFEKRIMSSGGGR